MEITMIVNMVTFFVALILGELAKRFDLINKNKIPLQNLCIGIIVSCIEYIITKDFKTSIMLSGITAGGVYDIFHNLNKILNKDGE